MENRLDLAKRVVIFSGSFAISLWIVIRFIAMGMFGSQLDLTWQDYWIQSFLWALGGGLLSGLLWGRSSLRNIFWLAAPGGMWLGLMLITLPFLLFDPPEASDTHYLLEYLSGLILFACVASFPVLGPFISHAVRNQKSWPEMREEIGARWTEFRNAFRNQLEPKGVSPFASFDRLPQTFRIIVALLLIPLIFWLLSW